MKLCEFITSLSCGGAETFAFQFALTAKQHGYDVTVLLMKPIDPADSFVGNRLSILDNAGIRYVTLNVGLECFHQLRLLMRTIAFFRKEQFDIIHSHNDREDVLVGIYRMLSFHQFSAVSTLHSSVLPMHGLTAKLRQFFHRHLIHSVFCGEEALRLNQKVFTKSTFVQNGIMFHSCGRAAQGMRPEHIPDYAPGTVKLLSVGRLESPKNHLRMIESIAALLKLGCNHFVLHIAGDGSLRSSLEKRIEELNLGKYIVLLGARSDISDLVEYSDYFISTSDYEGLPISVLEACAGHCPALLNPIPAHCALAERIRGCKVSQDMTPQSMAELIAESIRSGFGKAITDADWEDDMSEYTMEKCFQRYENIFRADF